MSDTALGISVGVLVVLTLVNTVLIFFPGAERGDA